MLLLLTCFGMIAGCGGGGGGNNNGVITLTPTATATETLQISSASLQLNGTATATATFLDLSGTPISGLPVTFTTSLGTLSPANGISTTDATGAASIQLSAGGTAGTGIITASGTVAGVKITKVVTFSVAFPQVTLSTPVLGLSSLAPGGSSSVTVTLTDAAGQLFTTPVDVSFTSNFSSTGKATLISPVRSVNGVASSTYTATGGVGTDTITVSVGTTSVTASLTVAGAAASSISFLSASPSNIALKGTGGVGRSETSTVIFKVLDVNGQPKSGQTVDFELNTTVGGLSLSSPSASSAADGTVSTIVLGGTVATPVRVTAKIHGSLPLIATQSDQLVVSTGLPAQNGFGLSVETSNPEALGFDGVTDVFTARLADHFGNPVPDGTAVNFSSQNGGSIVSSCTTVGGACSATWRSQGLRPIDGKVAVVAFAVGEESFVDSNGNGVADGLNASGNPVAGGSDFQACLNRGSATLPATCNEFTDMPQAFRDDLHLGVYSAGDPFWDFNGSGKVDRDGTFNGVLKPAAVPLSTKHVFKNAVLVLSGSVASTITLTPLVAPFGESVPVTLTVEDEKGNPMPSGTTITVASTADSTVKALTFSPASITVPNTNTPAAGTTFDLSVNNKFSGSSSTSEGVLVTVTTPKGTVTTKTFTFTYAP